MTDAVDAALVAHLDRDDGQEDVVFALYQLSSGATRSTALLVDIVLPEPGDREVHGNALFAGRYFLRAAGLAAERDLGVALLHSHPGGTGWQGLSHDDRAAEAGHASEALVLTGLPLVGLTLGTGDGGYAARRWRRTRPVDDGGDGGDDHDDGDDGDDREADWVDEQAVSVRIIGTGLRVNFNPTLAPVPPRTRRTRRTVQAWGRRPHQDLIRLRVGIIGAGSVGQLVAESLVRTGFVHVDVLDFDLVEPHNLDRLLHAYRRHQGQLKVRVLTRRLRRSASTPGAMVHGFDDSVVEPDGWAKALDCDVLFSCVDRPWPRYALNVAAYSHLIPVIDGGVAVDVELPDEVRTDDTEPDVDATTDSTSSDAVPERAPAGRRRRLVGAEWRAHLVGPGRKCMECLGQYDPSDVGLDRAGLLDDPKYIDALPRDHHLRRGENVFAFSMACAAAEVLELLRAVLAPSSMPDVGATLTHWTTATTTLDTTECAPGCPFNGDLLGRGDASPVTVTGRHLSAEISRARARRAAAAETGPQTPTSRQNRGLLTRAARAARIVRSTTRRTDR